MTIYSTSRELQSNIAINFPSEKCCNCGTSVKLSHVATDLKRTRFMLLGGTEITLKPSLPYCTDCVKTAGRQFVGVGSKLLVSVIVFCLLMISLAFIPDMITRVLPTGIMLPMFFILACALVFGFYSLRKPVGAQTSYYQPVRLRKVKQKFTGEIIGYALAFTNQQYKQDFVAVNQEAVGKQVIEAIDA